MFFFRPKKSINNDNMNFINLYDYTNENETNKNNNSNNNFSLIQRLKFYNPIQSISITQIIKTCSYLYISYYTFINIAMFLRKRNPNIFIIKRKLSGTLGKFYPGGFQTKMNINEACLILSISNKYNLNQIRESHKKLMLLNHPDFGGSSFIACKINEAKDLLTKNYKQNLKYNF